MNESIDYRAIVKWIRASQDAKSLRRLRKIIDERIHTLRTQGLRDWTKDDVDEFWRACSADAKRLIKILVEGVGAFKDDIMRDTGWKEMKVTGLIAGIINRARNMGLKDPIIGKWVRRNGTWTKRYILEDSFRDSLKYVV